MSSSHTKSPTGQSSTSLPHLQRESAIENPARLAIGEQISPLGGMNDDLMVRNLITESIKRCAKSREQIAEEMSTLLNLTVTERMISSFTSESKELHRWPGAWDRAFCAVVGDDRLLLCRVSLAGYTVISGTDVQLLELGRQYLTRKRSEAELADLERRLEGKEI